MEQTVSYKSFFLTVAMILVVSGALATAYYFYSQYQKSQQLLKNPSQAAQEEATALKTAVGVLMELPQGEEPTVATVSDTDKLKDQTFFARAVNGDKVLIYTQAQKAILYRPSINRIIEVAPVNVATSPTPGQTSTASALPSSLPSSGQAGQAKQVRVVLRNGTTTVGLTNKVEQQLKKAMPEATVSAKESAAKTDYNKTLVVFLSDTFKEAAQALSKALGGQVVALPLGESKPRDTDILVIVGKDKI